MTISLATCVLTVTMVCGTVLPKATAQAAAKGQTGWDRAAAAQYLDDRITLWFEKATRLRTGEGETSCISCHTVVPYLLARPALRRAMQQSEPVPQEARLLKDLARRVDTFPDHQSLSDSKHGGERATEAVLNALILARQDAGRKQHQPREVTRKAFKQLWETQRADGAWDWMDFAQEPDESRDSQYYGAALAAIAIGTVPSMYGASGVETDAAGNIDRLRTYLNGRYAGQNLYNRTWMLLASTRLAGLLNLEQREDLVGELKAKQNSDGGWSLYRLGPWKWSRATPPFAPSGKTDPSLLDRSDGYATGLIAYALRDAGLSVGDPALKKATDWLKINQKEVEIDQHVWKCWRTFSLNHDRENGGGHGEGFNRMLMSDIATAFAVLALSPVE